MDEISDSGLKGINERLKPDGVFMISPSIQEDDVLTINRKLISNGNHKINISFRSFTGEIHQFFYIKYNDKNDYYTITSIISHYSLGVIKDQNDNYKICDIAEQESKSIQWKITKDNEYFFTHKETDYKLQYDIKAKTLILTKECNTNAQKFLIFQKNLIENGFYTIRSTLPENLYITFSNKDVKRNLYLSKSQKDGQLFYIAYDKNDGCYSLINANNLKCFTPGKDSKVTSKVTQSDFYNLDYQKWIIGTYDNTNYFLIPKFNAEKEPLILCNSKTNKTDLFFRSSYHPDNTLNNNFQFQGITPSQNFKDTLERIASILQFRYKDEIVLDRKATNQREINDQLFENSYCIRKLILPIDINDISKSAFINCFRIKFIECHPKWLQFLPNKINVENIVVIDGTESAKENSFCGFHNLKYLKLPKSLKFKTCNPDLFNDIYGLKKFEGNLKFLQIIQKKSLTHLIIPSYVKKIPSGICSDCKNLSEVKIAENSSLKHIGSRAFAGCIQLRSFLTPESVENIEPDAFDNCNKDFDKKSLIRNEKQRFSYSKELVIDQNVTNITEKYKEYININSINIHLNVNKCDPEVLKSFKNLKLVKCDPKWLNDFDTNKIESVSIPDKIPEIEKKDFENLIHLKHIVIPESVKVIESGTFDNCTELTSIQCCLNHLEYLNQNQIKSIIISQCSRGINETDFKGFINLEYCKIPENTQEIHPSAFANCKKLMTIDYPLGRKLINNLADIDESINEITRKDFEGWKNLHTLAIPQSVSNIEENAFKDCTNIKVLKCDPKWFPYIPKYSIRRVFIPKFVKQINYGDFDGFDSMHYINLPENIIIDDNRVFDSCQNLKKIESKSPILSKLSDITLQRCDNISNSRYENPIFNFQPDPKKIHDSTDMAEFKELSATLTRSQMDHLMSKSIELSKLDNMRNNLSADAIIEFDKNAKKYYQYIIGVHDMIESDNPADDIEPNDTNISTISKVCGYICHAIVQNKDKKTFIIPNNVQIYAILRLADEILNNEKDENDDISKGSIAEIRAGEGKTLITTILAIILVKFGRSVDIVAPNIDLAKRDNKNQSAYFKLFNIKTAAFYDTENDKDQLTKSVIIKKSKRFEYFNIDAFECPVVYSNYRNFEFYYLHTLFDLNPRKRDFDIALINEVDNMLIDELDSPTVISKKINFDSLPSIFQKVYKMCEEDKTNVTNIIDELRDEFPNVKYFDEQDIELLKNAALEAISKNEGSDYVIEDGKIIVIDKNTGLKMPNSLWPNYVYEMVETKHDMLTDSSISIGQITQQTYFKRYKKIAAVTGSIGSETDEQILKEGYNVKTFKVPRNIPIKTEIYYQKRPETKEEIFNMVDDEIKEITSEGRPVLIIWDNKSNATKFLEKFKYENVNFVFGKNLIDDKIEEAGKEGAITMANSAAVKRVDIELTEDSKVNGGLHIIIPMQMSTIRSLEQAVGIAGKHGDPASVSIYISKKDDWYKNTPKFNQTNAYLDDLQLEFAKHLRDNYQWMLENSFYKIKQRNANKNIIFPFNATYSDILNIMSRHIFLVFKGIRFSDDNFRDLACEMAQIAWGVFFTHLVNEKYNNNSQLYCRKEYNRFIAEFNKFFSPYNCRTIKEAWNFINKMFNNEKSKDHFIYKGCNISSLGVNLIDINEIDNNNNNESIEQTNTNKRGLFSFVRRQCNFFSSVYNTVKSKIISNKQNIPNENIHLKSENIDIKRPSIKKIKRAMILANEAYNEDVKFSYGTVIYSSTINEKYRPVFYLLEYKNKLYVVIRGSYSEIDWHTDFDCNEILRNFDGFYIYFHYGFYTAANNILRDIKDFILKRDYKKIYFIGHSYAAAVSNVCCLLTRIDREYKGKNTFSLAFAPPPSMSKMPDKIHECIYQFINRADIVPLMSVENIKNTINMEKIDIEKFIDKNIKNLKLIPHHYARQIVEYAPKFKQDFIEIFKASKKTQHVTKNIGIIFYIGFDDTSLLHKCQVDQNDLNKFLYFTFAILNDHFMTEYIKSFEKIVDY